MNIHFREFINARRKVAEDHGLLWQMDVDQAGKVPKPQAWNLTLLAGQNAQPPAWLNSFAGDKVIVSSSRDEPQHTPADCARSLVLSCHWQDLIKAVAVQKVLYERKAAAPTNNGVLRPLRAIGTVAALQGLEPWQITRATIERAFTLAEKGQPSGKLAIDLAGRARDIFDAKHLTDNGPIARAAGSYNSHTSKGPRRKSKSLRKALDERKHSGKLPTAEAFWELARIVFTCRPQTFLDTQRFGMIRLLMVAGMRGGEVAAIPEDCIKWHHYTDIHGTRADEVGGVGRSLMLRHFAEKKVVTRSEGRAVYEAVQHVPPMFESAVLETVEEIRRLTAPLRRRLRAQVETGRIFPEFDPTERISLLEMYPRLTGDPFVFEDPRQDELIAEYRENLESSVLDRIEQRQRQLAREGAKIRNQVRLFYARNDGGAAPWPVHRHNNPAVYTHRYFIIEELEHFVRQQKRTKISDTGTHILENGETLQAHDLLFLAPKRALGEGRNSGICDIRRFAFVGTLQLHDLDHTLAGTNNTGATLFERYGETVQDRKLALRTHELRHLQNTELFRVGVSDAIITKRFNRQSVAQSYAYDHRSLAEELQSVSIPEMAERLPAKSREVFKLIRSGKANGLVVDEFKRIEKDEGLSAAIDFLETNADGFHLTPYGACVNSFTVEPCPKHLQCFEGCRHLMRTGLAEHENNLVELQKRLVRQAEAIDNHPAPPGAKVNMKADTKRKLDAIKQMMVTEPGDHVFPEGEDLAKPIAQTFKGPWNDATG
jgi:hypothetical protein